MKQLALLTLALAAFFLSARMLRAQSNPPHDEVTKVSNIENGVEVQLAGTALRVTALSPGVVRLRYAHMAPFGPDESFAVVKDTGLVAPKVEVQDTPTTVLLKTGELNVTINKSSLQVIFNDASGNTILADRSDLPFTYTAEGFQTWKRMPEDEHYYGLGDKAVSQDRRQHGFSMWNTDAVHWEESTDPLYKSIPFFIGIREGKAYGIFFDNTFRTNFQFGKLLTDFYSFGAPGGELNYYFINGPDPKKVLADYTALVGKTPLPPYFTLGYQQCRWSYPTEARVREVTSGFRQRNIPADVIYLDIDYQEKYRPFTINRQSFPTFEQMIKDLGQTGWKVVAITDLHIAAVPGYKPYDEGIKNNYFMKYPDGKVFVGPVWPGPAVFPDFTRAEVRQWWGTLYTDFVKMGVRGFWNDMNEPSVFDRPDKTMPLDVQSTLDDGRKIDERQAHNILGMQNVRATYEGLLKLEPNVRPFVLTRAAYAGAQRYAATWTGDNQATWQHMRLSLPTMTGLSVSGYPFTGADVGGFEGSPTPELLTRWTELGTFYPIDRNHAAKGTRDREPWVDGPEHEAIRKRYIEERYKLLPYIYTSMEETTRTGVPLMRLMMLDYPDDPRMVMRESDGEYMFGNDILVAPMVDDFVGGYDVLLPKGDWFDYWTGAKVAPKGGVIHVDPKLDELPVFVRGGAILPMQPVIQNTSETPQGPLQLRVFPGAKCQGSVYADDGNSFAYKQGDTFRDHFECSSSAAGVTVKIGAPEGKFAPWWKSYAVVLMNTAKSPSAVSVDGKSVSNFAFDAQAKTLSVEVPATQAASEIAIRW